MTTSWKKKSKKKEGFSLSPNVSPGAASTSVSYEVKKDQQSLQQDLDKKENSVLASSDDIGDKIEGELNQVLNGLSSLSISNNFYKSLGSAMEISSMTKESNIYGKVNFNFLDFKALSKTLGTMLKEFGQLIQYFFQLTLSYLILIKSSIELFVLNFNKYLNTTLEKIANALTNNTATKTEISTFQEETSRFLMLIMVWMIVYNWFYVCFYLKDSDNVRYTFNCDDMLNYSSMLYGAFGPGCRAVEVFNWLLITLSKNIQKLITSNAIIYVGLFFLFLVLVAANLPTVLLIDFFNALHHKYGTSPISVFCIGVVIYYGMRYFFYNSGLMRLLWQFPWFFGIPLFFIALFFYVMWVIAVNIPLAIVGVFAYLVIYSFIGILFYQGGNVFNTIAGISSDIAALGPDLAWSEICENPPEFRFRKIPFYIYHYGKWLLNWLVAYMSEILIILVLLGSTGLYLKRFKSSLEGKFSASAFSPGSMKQVFTYLFTWLIIINVLVISVLITFMVQKYNKIKESVPSFKSDDPKPVINITKAVPGFGGESYLKVPGGSETINESPIEGTTNNRNPNASNEQNNLETSDASNENPNASNVQETSASNDQETSASNEQTPPNT